MYPLDTNSGETNDDAYKWLADFQDLMSEVADEYDTIPGIEYLTGRSIDDAMEESISGEGSLFGITCEFIRVIPVRSTAIGIVVIYHTSSID